LHRGRLGRLLGVVGSSVVGGMPSAGRAQLSVGSPRASIARTRGVPGLVGCG
jgi:hypothetical protein